MKYGVYLPFYFSGTAVEICQTEIFTASCKEDEVIRMTSAKYGRMRLGRCVKVTTAKGDKRLI